MRWDDETERRLTERSKRLHPAGKYANPRRRSQVEEAIAVATLLTIVGVVVAIVLLLTLGGAM